jgi:hypothetical protein
VLDTLHRDSYLRAIPFFRSTGGAFRAPVGYVRFGGTQRDEMGRNANRPVEQEKEENGTYCGGEHPHE